MSLAELVSKAGSSKDEVIVVVVHVVAGILEVGQKPPCCCYRQGPLSPIGYGDVCSKESLKVQSGAKSREATNVYEPYGMTQPDNIMKSFPKVALDILRWRRQDRLYVLQLIFTGMLAADVVVSGGGCEAALKQ